MHALSFQGGISAVTWSSRPSPGIFCTYKMSSVQGGLSAVTWWSILELTAILCFKYQKKKIRNYVLQIKTGEGVYLF